MARFRYRMQNILNIKEKLESQAKNEYAQANMAYNARIEEKEALLLQQEALIAESRSLRLRESLCIRDIEDNKLSGELMKEKLKAQDRLIEEAKRNVEAKRQAMTALMQERKTHEILRERAFEQFLAEEKAQESKQIDELTSYVFGKEQVRKE